MGQQSLQNLSPQAGAMPLVQANVRGRRLSIVVPCYNEEEVFPETVKRLRALLDKLTASGKIEADSEIVFVDDGSKTRHGVLYVPRIWMTVVRAG